MGEVLILCYHAISERFPAPLSLSQNALLDQLSMLVRRGYRGATFSDALGRPREGKTLALIAGIDVLLATDDFTGMGLC